MSAIDTWNACAAFLLRVMDEPAGDQPSPLERARQTVARWRDLCATVPHRALAAAAHQGLDAGMVRTAIESHERGCLTLAGPTGTGKTVGAAWLAYRGSGSVLWIDAVAVGDADHERLAVWRRQIQSAGLVVLDDLGAGTSAGKWSRAKCATIVGAILDRLKPSILIQNMDREAFGEVMDGPQRGRLMSRAAMRPNVWIDIVGRDRRLTAPEPPEIEVLPPREAEAHALIQGRAKLREAAHAQVMADVDREGLKIVAKALGFVRWSDVYRAAQESERKIAEVAALVHETTSALRLVPARPEPTPDSGAEQRRRVALLDLLANVAERQGCKEDQILTRIGRTRRTLGPEDEPALLALLA